MNTGSQPNGAVTGSDSGLNEVCSNNVNEVRPNAVNGDSYASRAPRTAGSVSNPPQVWHPSTPGVNEMPKHPRSALFMPSCFTLVRSVFGALNIASINSPEV